LELKETKEERDLGITVTSNLKPSQQCVKAALKARSILGWINRHFGSLNVDEFKILYITRHMSGLTWNFVSKLGLHIFRKISDA